MGLFFNKKSEAPKPACSCSGGCSTPAESGDTGRMVKVLGGAAPNATSWKKPPRLP